MASCAVTAATAALACATPTPGDSRPWMFSHSLPRSARTLSSARRRRIPSEREKELSFLIAQVTGKLLRRNADHDMGMPSSVSVLPMMSGSAPIWFCQ